MKDRRSRVRREAPFLFVIALLLFAVLNSDYVLRRDQQQVAHHNRVLLVKVQRRGCERGMADRFVQIEGNYASYLQARVEGDGDAPTFLANVRSLMRRVDVGHSLIWPDPRGEKTTMQVVYRWPLGEGHFSCARAFPWPARASGVPFIAF